MCSSPCAPLYPHYLPLAAGPDGVLLGASFALSCSSATPPIDESRLVMAALSAVIARLLALDLKLQVRLGLRAQLFHLLDLVGLRCG